MTTRLERPLLLFDGDCGFCRFWVERWRSSVKGVVDFAPSQSERSRFPDIPDLAFVEGVVLVEPDGTTTYSAHAVLQALALGGKRWPLAFYRHVPGVAFVVDFVYRLIAAHRLALARPTRWLWGSDPSPDRHGIGTWTFLRALGLVALAAHLSLWSQVHGLIGARGILPLEPWLAAIRDRFGGAAWAEAPMLFWLGGSDRALDIACAAGCIASILLLLDLVPVLAALATWACYLSLTIACRDFLTFQWDMLLLETLVIAVLIAPLRILPGRPREPPALARWLLWWLAFRLMFMSGVVKLASGDPAWRDLTAMSFHHETQPIPATLAWYAHHFPMWWHRASTALTLVAELGLPFLIVAPRRLRHFTVLVFALLMLGIAASGNYGFFNLLCAALCLPLLHDGCFPRWMRERLAPDVMPPRAGGTVTGEAAPRPYGKVMATRQHGNLERHWPRFVLLPIATLAFMVTSVHMMDRFDIDVPWPRPVVAVAEVSSHFRSANGYGLFAIMTKERPEIVIEGSVDGIEWREYELPCKPGDVNRAPAYFEPHMPRLDWRLWFAALQPDRLSPWFPPLVQRLLDGSPDVLRLFERNPFPEAPPRLIRALVYKYQFTTAEERRASGAWWKREAAGVYLRPVSLEDFRR